MSRGSERKKEPGHTRYGRFLAVLLTAVLMISSSGLTAFAAESSEISDISSESEEPETEEETEVSETDPPETENTDVAETESPQSGPSESGGTTLPAEENEDAGESETSQSETSDDDISEEEQDEVETDLTSEDETEGDPDNDSGDKKDSTTKKKSKSSKKSSKAGNALLDSVIESAEDSYTIVGFSLDIYAYPPADTSENTKYIYKYLTEELGFNHAAACGVLANIHLESGFSQFALGDGGTSYGICQWHNERFNRLIWFCNTAGSDYNTLDGQLLYLSYELHDGYAGVRDYLMTVPNTAQGAYDAAYYWCMNYEAPSETQARAAQRGNLAKYEYFPLDLSMEEIEEESETEQESETEPETEMTEGPPEEENED